MNFIKPILNNVNKIEIFSLFSIYVLLIINAIIFKDNPIALLSAFFGISYTFWAGKGLPVCYLFGLAGSAFYCILAFHNALWGNLLLYALYYIPMQSVGFFKWNNNLKIGKKDIVKISLAKSEKLKLYGITSVTALVAIMVLYYTGDKSPIIDGITTVFSIAGMYLTVKRCIEQWIIWMIVNGLSLIMWLNILRSGTMVIATIIMWAVYFVLAFHFYFVWKKEIENN